MNIHAILSHIDLAGTVMGAALSVVVLVATSRVRRVPRIALVAVALWVAAQLGLLVAGTWEVAALGHGVLQHLVLALVYVHVAERVMRPSLPARGEA